MPRKMTTKDFVNKSIKKFGKVLDYSRVNYTNSVTNVELICPKHGSFLTTPNKHLNAKHPCLLCGSKKITINSFKNRAALIHKHKYDYSKVGKIKNNSSKVFITCHTHGDFKQIVANHLNGAGCPKCARNQKLTKKDFINKARDVHSLLYDYSLVDYKSGHKKVIIICGVHGEFYQDPYNHLSGKGCAKCAGKYVLNTDECIKRAKLVHGDKYDYSKVKFTDYLENMTIICRTHGEFKQLYTVHVNRGGGCPTCHKTTYDEFLKKSTEKFGNQVTFEKTSVFKNVLEKVTMTCNTHGDFKRSPYNHMKSVNPCPKCSKRVSEGEVMWLNFLNVKYRNYYINVNGKRFYVDGFDPETNTVYEFNGDYWHGNPEIYKPNDFNKNVKKTFGELYKKTIKKEKLLKKAGYNVISIWESEWKASF